MELNPAMLTAMSVDAFRLFVACLLGCFIGWERERRGRQAGIRTHGAIALAACLYSIVSVKLPGAVDAGRVAAQIVTGVGFLGAGVIFREGNAIAGLTTAATLWATAAVGMSVAFGLYYIASFTALVLFALLFLPRMSWWGLFSAKGQGKND